MAYRVYQPQKNQSSAIGWKSDSDNFFGTLLIDYKTSGWTFTGAYYVKIWALLKRGIKEKIHGNLPRSVFSPRLIYKARVCYDVVCFWTLTYFQTSKKHSVENILLMRCLQSTRILKTNPKDIFLRFRKIDWKIS